MLAKNLKFGIEIECYVPTKYADKHFVAGSYHHGIQIAVAPQGWKGEADGSLGNGFLLNGITYRPIEIVSPILAGEDGLAQVFYIAQVLSESGAIVNKNCGLHIHVNGRQLTIDQINQLVYEFRAYEDVLLAANGIKTEQRLDNFYCKTSDKWQGDPFNDRYRTLNLCNIVGSKKTVEFRLFAADTSPEFLVTAVYMVVAMVSRVTEDTSLPVLPRGTYHQKALTFVKTYWSKKAYRIDPESRIKDVVTVLLDQVAHADKQGLTVYRGL